MKIKQLNKIQQLYQEGKNLISYFREGKDTIFNDTESILISYDLQAGTYISYAYKMKEFNQNYTRAIAKIIDTLNVKSVLEAGVGEATTLKNVADKCSNEHTYFGFDLSWSRIKYAQKYCQENSQRNFKLFTGDLFNAPLLDNSVDLVYTSHSIEPNGGREKEAVEELYRIAAKYVVLLEPCYELANEESRQRMLSHGYITNLRKAIDDLGCHILDFRLFDYSSNPLNPTGITIIEKNKDGSSKANPMACPVTKAELSEYGDGFYCDKSLLAYPKLSGVPCLLPDNAIVASHFKNFIK